MSLATFRARIPAINSWLLAGVCASIPLTVAPAWWLTALMLLLWLIEGRFAEKFRALAGEPLVWIFVAYYAVFVVSLLWSTDLDWGRRMLGRQNFFLLAPLYFSVARREHVSRYLAAFLMSIALCELLAFYNWIQLNIWPSLPHGIRVEKGGDDTAPFVDRMMYTPALAMAGYLAGHRLLFEVRTLKARAAYAFLLLSTTFNLLISGGRAGLLGFIVLIGVLIFQRFARRPLLAGGVVVAMTGFLVLGGYFGVDYFRQRVDSGIDEVLHYEQRVNTSMGLRIVYALNTARMISESPWLGVGIGDFEAEYTRINAQYTPEWTPIYNPHNQYLYAQANAGVAASLLLIAVLFFPLFRNGPLDGRQRMRVAVPMLFIPICFFESYLMRSNLSLMYVVFLALLWSPARESRA